MKSKSLHCYNYDPKYVVNETCYLRVTRKVPTGLIKIISDVIFIDDIHLRVSLFYRYTGGFKPYVIDFTVDVCSLMEKKNFFVLNNAAMRFAIGLRKIYPAFFKGCPYKVR